MKFSPGDPVWVKSQGQQIPAGEHAGIIDGPCKFKYPGYYRVDIPQFPSPHPSWGTLWSVREAHLRPRRDDYQQKEGRITREKLFSSLNNPVLEEA